MIGRLGGYVLLGVATSLIATTMQRREELAVLRLSGTTLAQVRSTVRQEVGLLAAIAVTTGTAPSVVPLSLVGIGFLDRPLPGGPAWLLPAVVIAVAGVALLAVEVSMRWALRRGPAQTLSAGA